MNILIALFVSHILFFYVNAAIYFKLCSLDEKYSEIFFVYLLTFIPVVGTIVLIWFLAEAHKVNLKQIEKDSFEAGFNAGMREKNI